MQGRNAPPQEPVDGVLILKETVGRNLRVVVQQLLADILIPPAREVHKHDARVKIRRLRQYPEIGLDLVVDGRLLRHRKQRAAKICRIHAVQTPLHHGVAVQIEDTLHIGRQQFPEEKASQRAQIEFPGVGPLRKALFQLLTGQKNQFPPEIGRKCL